jgi:uncharacterized caspase-like protein
VKRPQNAHYQEVTLRLPVEDTDGENLRIAVSAETTGGTVSDRQILRLRRPQAEQNRGGLRVLAIGVGAYQKLPKLSFAAADAMAMGAALQAQAGEGTLYKGVNITILTDGEATLPNIRAALDRFTRDVRPGETLILSLSGHGLKDADQYYFAPVGLDPDKMAQTGLAWKDVLARVEVARKTAKAVWVLADTCRAAPGLRREMIASGEDLRRGVDEGANLILCTASTGDDPSFESEDLKHGLFTQAWLEALRGQGPDLVYEETPRGRVLTQSGLQFLVDSGVRRHARAAGVRQSVEFPRMEGSFSPGQPLFLAAATKK